MKKRSQKKGERSETKWEKERLQKECETLNSNYNMLTKTSSKKKFDLGNLRHGVNDLHTVPKMIW